MSDAAYEAVAVYSQVVASILFIIALVVIWNRYLAPAVIASQARKNAELADAEKRRDEAKALIEAAKSENALADADVNAIAERARADANRISERVLGEATAEGERLVTNANGELERSRTAAKAALRSEIFEKAMTIARTAARGIDRDSDRRLVEDAVATADRKAGT